MNMKVFAILNELTARHAEFTRQLADSGFHNVGPCVTGQVNATIEATKAIAEVYANKDRACSSCGAELPAKCADCVEQNEQRELETVGDRQDRLAWEKADHLANLDRQNREEV